jgi:hypothetical protein
MHYLLPVVFSYEYSKENFIYLFILYNCIAGLRVILIENFKRYECRFAPRMNLFELHPDWCPSTQELFSQCQYP